MNTFSDVTNSCAIIPAIPIIARRPLLISFVLMRSNSLESLGVRFLRFTDTDVKRNMEMVVDSIERWMDESSR